MRFITDYNSKTNKNFRESLRYDIWAVALLIKRDGSVTGFASLDVTAEKDEAALEAGRAKSTYLYINDVCVRTKGSGDGRLLVQEIIDLAKESALKNGTPFAGVTLNSVPSAVKFYEKFGFEPEDEEAMAACAAGKECKMILRF